jgi:hypothetical protein
LSTASPAKTSCQCARRRRCSREPRRPEAHPAAAAQAERGDIAEIDALIALRHWQNEQEGQNLLRCDRESLFLPYVPHDPVAEEVGLGPLRPAGCGVLTVGGDGFYGREADGLPEAARVGGRDRAPRRADQVRAGTRRTAIHFGQSSEIDPSWQLSQRTRGVPPNDWDRAVKAIIKELLRLAHRR